MKVLVTGFGPFPGTPHNPTDALCRSVTGLRVGALELRGVVLPVSYRRGPDAAIADALALGPELALVLGLGVAGARTGVWVERTARRVDAGPIDVDGRSDAALFGPPEVRATLDVDRLAEALGAGVSDDAGQYVCNAWLYRVSQAVDAPVGFVHVPPAGLPLATLLAGIAALTQGASGS